MHSPPSRLLRHRRARRDRAIDAIALLILIVIAMPASIRSEWGLIAQALATLTALWLARWAARGLADEAAWTDRGYAWGLAGVALALVIVVGAIWA